MQEFVNLSIERYNQLIRLENDANLLKAVISDAHDNYRSIERDDIKILYTMFIGNKED